jgi:hypothetical protein
MSARGELIVCQQCHTLLEPDKDSISGLSVWRLVAWGTLVVPLMWSGIVVELKVESLGKPEFMPILIGLLLTFPILMLMLLFLYVSMVRFRKAVL